MANTNNPRFPHTCKITRSGSDDYDPMHPQPRETTIYEGACRSEAKYATNERGEVVSSNRRLSIPLKKDDWKQLGIAPMAGDSIEVDKDGVAHEYGSVIDFVPNNLGTTILYIFNMN